MYRYYANEICRNNEMSRTEFEILLFAYDYDYINRKSLDTYVPCSRTTLKLSLLSLVNDEKLKIIRERSHYKSRLYSLTRKSKMIINKFYKQLNNN
tara:strand:- start:2000 stop:2287 length:288 start_codon:yes stop_codon:yes gene_type:complete